MRTHELLILILNIVFVLVMVVRSLFWYDRWELRELDVFCVVVLALFFIYDIYYLTERLL